MNTIDRPIVMTESGSVRGTVERGITAFRGIPYAASPMGERRFAAPEPHPGWRGVRDAARSGPSVPQGVSRLAAVMGPRTPDGDEDGCLTVHVWSPRTRTDGPAGRPLPVLVWFHGGGFTSGAGGWDWYDGGNLAAAGELIVVTANYRVGPLGYLYLPELGVDNLGTRDQAAALAWVRRNITSFGGDPDDITVGGQSAGAFSAFHLAASPVTGAHINRLVTQSGPFGLTPQHPDEAAARARDYLDIFDVRHDRNPLRALREVPVEQLLTAYQRLTRRLAPQPGSVAPPMYPVLGAWGTPSSWQQALAEGRLDGKPLLTGTTRDEMTAFLAFDPRIRNITAGQARSIAAEQIPGGADRFDRTAARSPAATPGEVLTELGTELVFRDGALTVADHHVMAGNTTYVYQFDYSPPDDPAHLGAAHCVELPFFFNTLDAYPQSPMLGEVTTAARRLGETFSRAVATFAATGRPAAGRWPPYSCGDPSTIRHFA